jgi:hypothetical protein
VDADTVGKIMSRDTYSRVKTYFLRASEKAVLIRSYGRDVWVPRSLLHADSDTRIPDMGGGEEVILQIREWFVEQESL